MVEYGMRMNMTKPTNSVNRKVESFFLARVRVRARTCEGFLLIVWV